MFWRCFFLTLAFLHLLAPPARAADKAWEDCGQTADQDRQSQEKATPEHLILQPKHVGEGGAAHLVVTARVTPMSPRPG